MQLFINFFDLN